MQPDVKFNIFSGLLKASKDAEGAMRLHGVASSTVKDLHGDDMEQSALDDMMATANAGLTIFLNHSYEVPEDMGGWVERAAVAKRGTKEDGSPIWDLDFDVLINGVNPRAVASWEGIYNSKGKAKVGLSIGAMIPEGGATRRKDGTYLISHVNLLEASIVGIPANPRSWIDYAVKALKGIQKDAVKLETSAPTITLDAETGMYRIEGQLDGVAMVTDGMVAKSHNELPDSAFACISPGGKKDSSGKTTPRSLRHYPHHTMSGALDTALLKSYLEKNALARIGDPGNEQCGKAHLEAHAKSAGIGDREKTDALAEADFLEALTDDFDVHHFLTDAASPDFSHEHDHAHEHEHEHSHEDGTTHTHDHAHQHSHDHGHGGEEDHPHSEAMNSPEHDHSHGDDGGEHPHESDRDSDDGAGNTSDERKDGDDDDKSEKALDLEDAKVTIIQIDTDSPSDDAPPQGAPASNPETDGALADETAEGDDAALGDTVTRELAREALPEVAKTITDLLATLTATTNELVTARKDLVAERVLRINAEASEARTREVSATLLSRTSEVIDKIASTPMGRRTRFTEAVSKFENLREIYSDEFIELLQKES
jgi:hypothetical protein